MNRYIDAELLKSRFIPHSDYDSDVVREAIDLAPSIETKQIKYFDEEEKVWKIGEVIVNQAEGADDE